MGVKSMLTKNTGSNAAAHMSENVDDAGRNISIATAWGYFSNLIMAVNS